MSNVVLYILTILVYLGISKNFSLQRPLAITQKEMFSFYFSKAPVSVVLLESFSSGNFIPTYYHRYKIISGHQATTEVLARVSKSFQDENINNIGMSLYRKMIGQRPSTLPMPPGTLFINNRVYGRWKRRRKRKAYWNFHRGYRHLSREFLWGKFRPTKKFYKLIKKHIQDDVPFYGDNNQFGTFGELTQKMLPVKKRSSKELNLEKIFRPLIWPLGQNNE